MRDFREKIAQIVQEGWYHGEIAAIECADKILALPEFKKLANPDTIAAITYKYIRTGRRSISTDLSVAEKIIEDVFFDTDEVSKKKLELWDELVEALKEMNTWPSDSPGFLPKIRQLYLKAKALEVKNG